MNNYLHIARGGAASISSVMVSIITMNRNGLSAEPCCKPTSILTAVPAVVFTDVVQSSYISLISHYKIINSCEITPKTGAGACVHRIVKSESSVTLNKRAIQKLIEMRLYPQITHKGILRGPQTQTKI